MSWHPAPDPEQEQHRRLDEAIERYLDRGGHGDVSLLAKVIDAWESSVGPHVASHVWPTSIGNDTLWVDVDQPAWSTEVTFIASRLLTALEARVGRPVATYVKPRVRGRSDVE